MGSHDHYCKKTRRILPSVTTITGEMIPSDYSWWNRSLEAKGIDPKWKLNQMGMIGTICHYRVLSKLSPVPIEAPDFPVSDYPENSLHFADLVEMMWDMLGFKIKRATCEKKCVNEKLGYCGTFDLKGLFSGTFRDKRTGREITLKNARVLADIKTSKEAKESYYYQLAAYSLFFESPPDYGLVICLCPYIEKNQNLLPMVYVLNQKEIVEYQKKFVKLVKDWWKIHQ